MYFNHQRTTILAAVVTMSLWPTCVRAQADKDLFPGAKHLSTIVVGYGNHPVLFLGTSGPKIVAYTGDADPKQGNVERKLRVWDAVTGKPAAVVGKDLFDYQYLAISPDETRRLDIAYLDPIVPNGGVPQPGPGVTRPFRYKVSLVDVKANKPLFSNQMNCYMRPVVRFAPDSSSAVLIGDTEFYTVTPGAAKPVKQTAMARKMMQTVYGVRTVTQELGAQFTPDGSRLAIGVDGVVRFYDLAKGTVAYETPAAPQRNPMFAENLAFAFPHSTAAAKMLVSGGNPQDTKIAPGGDFRMYDLQARKLLWNAKLENPGGLASVSTQPYFTAKDEPRAFFFTSKYQPKEKAFDYTGYIVDASKGKIIQQFTSKGHHIYQVSADGSYLVRISFDSPRYLGKQTVDVWSLDKWRRLRLGVYLTLSR